MTVVKQRGDKAPVILSIVMPIACSDEQFASVLTALFAWNAAFLRRVPTEFIILDSVPNPGIRGKVAHVRKLARDLDLGITFIETTTVGSGAKFAEGLGHASGTYSLFLTDEVLPVYDVLTDVLDLAQSGYFSSLTFIHPERPEGGSHPLRYPRHAPVMPVTFGVTRTDVYRKLVRNIPGHAFGTLHWCLGCWDLGLRPAYSTRQLQYCPLINFDASRPAVYTPIPKSFRDDNLRQLLRHWPLSRIRDMHAILTREAMQVVEQRDPHLWVVTTARGGVYFVVPTADVGLSDRYRLLSDPHDVKHACEAALEEWEASGVDVLKGFLA